MSFEIRTHQRRTRDFTVTLYEADGTTELTLAANDVVRFKIGSDGAVPLLDLSSIEASGNGSSLTFTAGTGNCVVRLAGGDVANLKGAYDCEILVVDNSETAPPDAAKHAEYGVLFVHPTMQGDLTEDESSSSQSNSESSESSSENSSSSSSS